MTPSTLRTIPEVNEDGVIQTTNHSEIFTHHVCIHHYETQEILSACSSSADQLLLDYRDKTTSDKITRMWVASIGHSILALLPCLLIIGVLPKPTRLPVLVLLMSGVILRAIWIEYYKPGNLWQSTDWLDLKTRTLHKRMNYLDGSLPTNTLSIPLDNLILVCFKEIWGDEQPETMYRVGLCEAQELAILRTGKSPSILNNLQYTKTEEAAIAFTKELAQLWKIPAWRGYDTGMLFSPHVQKLHS
jgi:hypothetical protein